MENICWKILSAKSIANLSINFREADANQYTPDSSESSTRQRCQNVYKEQSQHADYRNSHTPQFPQKPTVPPKPTINLINPQAGQSFKVSSRGHLPSENVLNGFNNFFSKDKGEVMQGSQQSLRSNSVC